VPRSTPLEAPLRADGWWERRGLVRHGQHQAAGLVLMLGVVVLSSCSGDRSPESLKRRGPFGSLRDLVLFERGSEQGGSFFLDRFEVTRSDFAEFARNSRGPTTGANSSVVGGELAAHPATRVDLRTARAFAAWRHCRLPRADEWWFACTTDGRDAYQWGSRPDASRANTSDLGVFAPLPVGTFESGRAQQGPYDLIGNVAEWTESVPVSWFYIDHREPVPAMTLAYDAVAQSPGLSLWAPVPLVFPSLFLVVAAGDRAPREVTGAHFASARDDGSDFRSPTDFGDTLGFRLCTTPRELIEAIGDELLRFEDGDLLQWERFCGRPGHGSVLARALPACAISARARSRWQERLP
jgi:hypothetical protein